MARRVRDYHREYLQRQEKARREGYRSYGAKRYAKEAPKRAERRARRREIREAGAPRREARERERLEQEAIQNYRKKFGTAASASTLRKGIRWLSIEELREARSASRLRLQFLARQEPYLTRNGKEVNPYWYH